MSDATTTFALDALKRLTQPLDELYDATSSAKPVTASATAAEEELTDEEGVIMLDLNKLPSREALIEALDSIPAATASLTSVAAVASSEEDAASLISLGRVAAATYALVLHALVRDAHVLASAAWEWENVAGSRQSSAMYLVQTLPERLLALAQLGVSMTSQTATNTLHSKPSTLLSRHTLTQAWRALVDSPIQARVALFPQSSGTSASASASSASASTNKTTPSGSTLRTLRHASPLRLASHEAEAKRRQALQARDVLASKLGQLALDLNEGVISSCEAEHHAAMLTKELNLRLAQMYRAISSEAQSQGNTVVARQALRRLLTEHLPAAHARLATTLSPSPVGLGPPTLLARAWPSLVLVPIGSIVALRIALRNWDGVKAKLQDARETVRGFVIGWVWEPVLGLLDTVRHGEQGGMIISAESLNSDVQSLERMVVAFSSEKYGMQGADLDAVARRVRAGDLSEVLKIYEEELKSPLKSTLTGSLVRSLLIQIQKAKVDLEVAMSGIDRLLKSQQLLFGAVGVAPAMGLVYLIVSWARKRLGSVAGQGTKRKREETKAQVWEAMR